MVIFIDFSNHFDVKNTLFKYRYLVGIASFGKGCGFGSVYTRVTHFFNWIKQQLEENA